MYDLDKELTGLTGVYSLDKKRSSSMELADVKKYLKDNENDDQVKAFIAGLKPADVNIETVKKFLDTNTEGQAFLRQHTDKRVHEGIDTFEENFKKDKLPGLIDAAVKERHPDETPEQKRIAELEKGQALSKKETVKANLLNKVITIANEKKLPADLVEQLLDSELDENKTLENLGKYEKVFTDKLTAAVEERFKEHGRDVLKPGSQNLSKEDISKLSPERRLALANEAIFAKNT